MKKELAFLMLLVFSVSLVYGAAEKFSEEEKVRVIVKVKGKSVDDAVSQLLKQDRKGAFGILSAEPKIVVKRKYSVINGFSAEVTRKELDKLKSNPLFEVQEDEVVRIFLDSSVPLINASLAWPLIYNSSNLTGNSETVCVIDTGVNSSHPGLAGVVIAQYCYCGVSDYGSGGCCNNNELTGNSSEDDHGHGTHVSGIIASQNQTYKGVAPGARIVSIKTFDSAGYGLSSDIVSAIDWCISNASLYNISVISLSAGGGSYTSYCDGAQTSYRDAINNATARNISFVAATGNAGSSTSISSPACIQNATAVTSTTKGDAISSFSNRNNVTDLAAPGTSITSLDYDGTTVAMSGTSMATPHASAAFALLHQYYKLSENRSASHSEIEAALRGTGRQVNDSGGSNLNFSRINIYAAILSADSSPPNLTFIPPTPANSTNTTNASVWINITADEVIPFGFLQWANGSFLTNYSMSCSANYCSINQSAGFGFFRYKVYANDSANNFGVTEEREIQLNNSPPYISDFFPADTNMSVMEPSSQRFNVSVFDPESQEVTFYWYLNSSLQLSGINETEWNFTGSYDSNASYNVTAVFSDGALAGYHRWLFGVNDTSRAPNITLNSPANNSNSTISNSVLLNYTVSDGDGDNVSCSLYGENISQPNTIINFTLNVSNATALAYNWTGLNDTMYYWLVQCNDSSNSTNSTVYFFTVDVTAPTAGPVLTQPNVSDYDFDGNIEINWSDVSAESGESYRLFRHSSNITDADSLTPTYSGIAEGTQFFEDNLTVHGATYWYALVTVDSFGNYNDSAVSASFNATANDTIKPKSPVNLTIAASGNIATIAWLNVTQDVNNNSDWKGLFYEVWYSSSSPNITNSTLVDDAGSGFTSLGNVSTNYTTYTYTHSLGGTQSSTFHFVVVSVDDANNTNKTIVASGTLSNYGNVTLTYTQPAAASSGGGGGGGGGGAAADSSGKASHYYSLITRGEEGSMALTRTELAVTSITFKANTQVEAATVSAQAVNESEVPQKAENVYQYFKVETQNIGDDDIMYAEIFFSVNRSWLLQNSLDPDKVFLLRHKGYWQRLVTKRVNSSATQYKYSASSPGFSFFAITAEKTDEKMPEQRAQQNISAEDKEPVPGQEQLPEEIDAVDKRQDRFSFYHFIVLLGVLLVSLLVLGNRKKRQAGARRDNSSKKQL